MQPDTRPARILVVHDDKDQQIILWERLRHHGYIVDVIDSGRYALHMVRGATPYNVAVIDLHMFGYSGLDTIRRIRELQAEGQVPPLWCAAVTSGYDHGLEETALAYGFNAFYRMPAHGLESAIRRVLGRGH